MRQITCLILFFSMGYLVAQEPELTIDDYGFQINDYSIPFQLPSEYESVKTVKLENKLFANKKYSVSFWVTARKSPKWKSYSYYFWVFPSNFMDKPTREDKNLTESVDIIPDVHVGTLRNYEKEHLKFIVTPDTTYTHITIGLNKKGDSFINMKDYVDVTGVFVRPLSDKDVENKDREFINNGKNFSVNNEKITIQVYDHKRIDNDIITLYLNDVILVDNLVLKRKKKKFKAKLKPGVNTIRLHADNLGEISPNTAAVIIKSGDQIIEQVLTSDLNKSEYFTVIYNEK